MLWIFERKILLKYLETISISRELFFVSSQYLYVGWQGGRLLTWRKSTKRSNEGWWLGPSWKIPQFLLVLFLLYHYINIISGYVQTVRDICLCLRLLLLPTSSVVPPLQSPWSTPIAEVTLPSMPLQDPVPTVTSLLPPLTISTTKAILFLLSKITLLMLQNQLMKKKGILKLFPPPIQKIILKPPKITLLLLFRLRRSPSTKGRLTGRGSRPVPTQRTGSRNSVTKMK